MFVDKTEGRRRYHKTPAPVANEPQIDMGECRQRRIENLGKGLQNAIKEDNYGKRRFFQREIEIQKAYQLLERAEQIKANGTTGKTIDRIMNELANPSGYN